MGWQRKPKMWRYQSLDFDGAVLGVGDRIQDVEGPGRRLIVDYRGKRHTITGEYPQWRYARSPGITIGDVLRACDQLEGTGKEGNRSV